MRFVVIGNGKMAIDVMQALWSTPGAKVTLCIGDPAYETAQSRLALACGDRGIPYRINANINSAEIIAAMREAAPDYLVSANNFQIFRTPSLSVPRFGVVNFHNAPLPRYGGLNACSWALMNGEREHGVTWHLVDAGIDSGPILTQRCFPIEAEDTAISLISRCIRLGVEVFRPLAQELVAGTAKPLSQRHEDRLYFGLKDRPFDGELPWWEALSEVRRLARALSFHPMPNLFFRPRFGVDPDKPLFAERIDVRSHETRVPPGTIVDIAADEIAIALPDGIVTASGIFDGPGAAAPANAGQFEIKIGSRLTKPAWLAK